MSNRADQLVKIGIVGLGGGARQMIPAITKHPNMQIVAAADVDSTALRNFTNDFQVSAFADAEELCSQQEIDAVYVATPNHLHLQHASWALQRGKHVLLEKPMTMTLSEADVIIDAAESRSLSLVVCSPHSFAPPTTQILSMIQQGKLGSVKMINTWYYGDWLYRPRTPDELNPDPSYGGGVVFRQAPHQIDMLRTVAGGKVTTLSANVGIWDLDRPVPGAYTAYLRFENGISAPAVYSGYDRFQTGEITYGHSLPPQPHRYGQARTARRSTDSSLELTAKQSGRYGGSSPVAVFREDAPKSFPWISDLLFVVTGDAGEVRVTPNSVIYYGDDVVEEIQLDPDVTGRDGLINQLYDSITGEKRATHDGRWGKATLEVCLGIMNAAQSQKEAEMIYQQGLEID